MFEDVSPVLALPYIMPAQAQKHITHNEAIGRLDALVQMSVKTRGLQAPPEEAVDGDRYLVPPGASGLWAPHVGKLAFHIGNGWEFAAPNEGWSSWVEDEDLFLIYDGSAWRSETERTLAVQRLGVSATPDDLNRLSVASAASLFNNAGSGHQIKVNKATVSDTASLLFQSGFSGRAEMGLAGSDDFSVKVSPDGTAWTDALRIDAATGRTGLPMGVDLGAGAESDPAICFANATGTGFYLTQDNQLGIAIEGVKRGHFATSGLVLDVDVTGSAVTQGQADTTPGRLLKVGDYGWGAIAPSVTDANALDAILTNQRVRVLSANAATVNAPLGAQGGVCDTYAFSAANAYQEYREITGAYRMWRRGWGSATWSAWVRMPNLIAGAITASGGEATHGGILERGSNANGDYTRFADGTQMCWRSLTGSTASGSVWSFPAVFATAPVVGCNAVASVQVAVTLDAAPTVSGVTVSARGTNDARRAVAMHLTAIGRWF